MPTITQRVSLNVPETDAQAIRDAIKVLQDKLVPHLIDLGPEERRGLPKMGDKTVSFVSQTLDYAREHRDMCPPFVDIEEFARDIEAVDLLMALQRPLIQVMDMVDDTLLLAGSEAYSAALACYQAIKSAARLNVPGAATIAEDLGRRFPARGGRVGQPAKGGLDGNGDAESGKSTVGP